LIQSLNSTNIYPVSKANYQRL